MNRVIKNFENLPNEVKKGFTAFYEEGLEGAIMRITKPDKSIVFAVPYQTEDTYYLVKISSLAGVDEDFGLDEDFFNDFDSDTYEASDGDSFL